MERKTNKIVLVGIAMALFLTIAFVGTALALDVSSNTSVKSGGSNVSLVGKGYSEGSVSSNFTGGPAKIQPPTEMPRSDSLVEVYIEPKQIVSETGQAFYKVVIKDNHAFVPPCTGEVCPAVVPALYLYKLTFEGDEEISGKFSEESVQILGGNKAEVKLEVYVAKTKTSTDEGSVEALPPVRLSSYRFQVTVLSADAKATADGKLIVPGGEPPEEKGPYFIGKGFGLSDDSSAGVSIDLNIFQGKNDGSSDGIIGSKNYLNGKISVENTPYRVEGAFGEKFSLNVYNPNSKESVGTLSGAVKKYSSFTLLTGTLVLDGKNWKVTAFSNKEGVVFDRIVDVNASSSESSTEIASVNETLVISSSTSTFADNSVEEKGVVSVKPIEVRKSKFLWVFSTGKQEAVVEVDDGSTQSTIVIKEGKSKKIGDYIVSAESMTSEGQLNVKIRADKQ